MAHLEHLEGKMRSGPPAWQDKGYRVGQTSTLQLRRTQHQELTEMRISDRETQNQEKSAGRLTAAATLHTTIK